MEMTENVPSEAIRISVRGLPSCNHWMQRKKRYCKLEAITGKRFCGEHLEPDPEDTESDNGRIPCPLDGKHTVYAKKLKKHLKICNARPKTSLEPYIVKDYNAPPVILESVENKSSADNSEIRLTLLSDEEFYGLIERIEKVHAKVKAGQIELIENQPHALVMEQLAVENCGKETRKHLLQVSALLKILEKEQVFRDNTNFLELGAGKGQLAVYVAKLLSEANRQGCRVILVDRSNLRHKKDNKIPDRTLVQRINADIRDLRYDKLPTMSEGRRCVVLSKHLCGNGTDLALRCITQPAEQQQSIDVIVMALCCHHRCDWQSFTGQRFFVQERFSERDFRILIKMVSWAVCGVGHRIGGNDVNQKDESKEDEKQCTPIPPPPTVPMETQRLNRQQRESIGFKCKELLDYARCQFLRDHDFEVELKHYVPRDVTMENVVLVARSKSSSKT